MTEPSFWKFADWPELAIVVQKWSAETWVWDLDVMSVELRELGWTPRKSVRAMLLYTTGLSVDTEAILRLDNDDNTVVRSLAIAVTSVVTAHESNTRKAKAFLTESHTEICASLQKVLGTPPIESSELTSRWDVSQGHVVATLTNRSVRMTFYSQAGMKQADAAEKTKALTAGVVKKRKAPAPWRVAGS